MTDANRKYKRQLISEVELQQRAKVWAQNLEPIYKAWQAGALQPCEVAVLYLLIGLETVYPNRWVVGPQSIGVSAMGGPRLHQWLARTERLSQWTNESTTLGEFISKFSFVGVRQVAREVLIQWMGGQFPVKLMATMPDARAMLELQAQGIRPVTAFFEEPQLSRVIHDGRDALSFFLHDLGHISQFYARPDWFQGQLKIYKMLLKAKSVGLLARPSQHSLVWQERLEYLISDLNTHPAHFVSVFWATARECILEHGDEQVFSLWRQELYCCWGLPPNMTSAFEGLCVDRNPQAAQTVYEYLIMQ